MLNTLSKRITMMFFDQKELTQIHQEYVIWYSSILLKSLNFFINEIVKCDSNHSNRAAALKFGIWPFWKSFSNFLSITWMKTDNQFIQFLNDTKIGFWKMNILNRVKWWVKNNNMQCNRNEYKWTYLCLKQQMQSTDLENFNVIRINVRF